MAKITYKKPKIFIWKGGKSGGAEMVMSAIAREFQTRGFEVTIGCFRGCIEDDVRSEHLELIPLYSGKVVGYLHILASLVARFRGILDSYDIIISHTGGFWKTRKNYFVYHEAVDLYKMLKRLPLISGLFAFIPILINILSLKNSDIVVSGSESAYRFAKKIGISKVIKSSSFFNDSVFKKVNKKKISKQFKLLFIGRPKDPNKNFKALLKSIDMISNVSLTSTGFYKPHKNVTYIGWVNQETIAEKIFGAHGVILPSFSEGFSLTLLEALGSGVPVIASKNAIPTELKSYIIPTDPDVSHIQEAITLLISNYATFKDRAEKNASIIRKKYAQSVVIPQEVTSIIQQWQKDNPEKKFL